MAKNSNHTPAGEQLRLLIERAERIKAEIKEMQADEKDVYAEAKSVGFDVNVIKRIIKWRSTDKNKRQEDEALFETYLAALGLLEGSLSDNARNYLEDKVRPTVKPIDGEGQHDAFPTQTPKGPVNEDFGEDLSDKPLTEEDAARLGADAARAGRPVTSNPFKAGDDRRAAWDEAWCNALGSDGMDIPPELRPTPKKKKGDKPEGEQPADDKPKGDDKGDKPADKKGK